MISSQTELEEAALHYGILPFFPNNIPGFSVEEMCAPGMLFGGNEYEGCWEWKGPVVRNRTTAYGKFFRRKAGFVSRELLPYFLKFRREAYPISPGSTEEVLFEIIEINDRMSSTDLRNIINNKPRKRQAFDLPDYAVYGSDSGIQTGSGSSKRHKLEGPLQRLQMGGWICISDFVYKQTRKGDRYGWGVAEYSTPGFLFDLPDLAGLPSAEECLEIIVEKTAKTTGASKDKLLKLLK